MLYIDREEIENEKSKLDAMWNPDGQEIKRFKTLPGTRSAHYFETVEPYVIRYAQHAAVDTSDMGIFSFKAKKDDSVNDETASVQPAVPLHGMKYTCGQWVNVEYESDIYHGLILNVKNDQYQIRCLKKAATGTTFTFEPERDTIWYTSGQIKSSMEVEPMLLNARGMYKV